MRVAINFRITYNSDKAIGMFTWELWEDIVILKPDHEFLFVTDRDKMPNQPQKNLQIQNLQPSNIKWLDKKKLRKALANWQTDLFITISENGFIINHNFLQKENKENVSANQQVSFTNAEAQPNSDFSLTAVIKPACRTVITELSWTEAESIKTQYSGGRSFFLFIGSIGEQHQLIELLKAFSLFKKWQQSNMQLVIAGYTTAWTKMLEEKLQTYKYKTDVVIVKNKPGEEMAKLLAASYAVLYPVAENAFPLALIWSVQSGKAIIATDNYINRQITTAAEWVDKNNTAEGFAKAMILLYKDEKQQQLLVQQNTEQAKQFNRQHMLAEVWRCIEN